MEEPVTETIGLDMGFIKEHLSQRIKQSFHDLIQTMNASPYHICPPIPVPYAAHEECDEQIQALTHLALPVPAEGNINIIFKPR